ncbi:MAG TPA: ATPase, T2SS/T4P/T4SS family, partial [Humisphaera sp.]
MSETAAPAAEPLFDPAVVSPETAVMVVIAKAVGLGASDLHLSSNPEGGVDVGIRHLGIIRPLASLPPELAKRSISHLKARAGLDIAERRRPQDGRWIQVVDGKTVDLRIATVPTLHGEDVAIRLLVRNLERLRLDGLGLAASQLGQLRAMIRAGGGLVLVSGPTGSGKTATLYASLLELADGTRKINTIEDPVEYV